MFAVLFEVQPKFEKWDEYLGIAKLLKPELEAIEGFAENIRYRSLTREGWLLSLSTWRNEKALVRWRTKATHHRAQERGRFEVFGDYHLRVGELVGTRDHSPPGEPRADDTEVGAGTAVTLLNAQRAPDRVKESDAESLASDLGLQGEAKGLVGWDVFEAVLTPGDLILLLTWRNEAPAAAFEGQPLRSGTTLRRVRIVRDYGMFDRREAPQYYPDVERG